MIEVWKIRAAREALGWSQSQLAKRAGATQPYISELEKEKIENPSAQTLENIERAFQAEGIYFTPDGIQKRSSNIFTIEGADCYLRLLEDAERVLAPGEEFLKSGADERRSSPEVIQALNSLRRAGVKTRSLIEHGNTHIMGPLGEYRWMDKSLFVKGDVKVIYADRVAYLVAWAKPPKAIIIQDKIIAEEARRNFEFIWSRSERPDKTTAKQFYEGGA
jgi:transcriptional regulator with XRE-family HTH domain